MNEAIFLSESARENEVVKEIIKLQEEVRYELNDLEIDTAKIELKNKNGKLIPYIEIDEKILTQRCVQIIEKMQKIKCAYLKFKELVESKN